MFRVVAKEGRTVIQRNNSGSMGVVLCVGFMGSRVGLVPHINFQIFFYAYEWLFRKCEVAVQRPGEQVVASAEQHRRESAQSHKRDSHRDLMCPLPVTLTGREDWKLFGKKSQKIHIKYQ